MTLQAALLLPTSFCSSFPLPFKEAELQGEAEKVADQALLGLECKYHVRFLNEWYGWLSFQGIHETPGLKWRRNLGLYTARSLANNKLAAIRFVKCCASLLNCDFCTVFKAKSGHFRICLIYCLLNMHGVACICLSLKQDSRCKTICPTSCLKCISLFENVSLHLPPCRKFSKLIYLIGL